MTVFKSLSYVFFLLFFAHVHYIITQYNLKIYFHNLKLSIFSIFYTPFVSVVLAFKS